MAAVIAIAAGIIGAGIVTFTLIEALARWRANRVVKRTIMSEWQHSPAGGEHAVYITQDGNADLRLAIRASIEQALGKEPSARFVIVAPRAGPIKKDLSEGAQSRGTEADQSDAESWLTDKDPMRIINETMRLFLEESEKGKPVHVFALYSGDRLELVGPRAQAEVEAVFDRQVHEANNAASVTCSYSLDSILKYRESIGYEKLIQTIETCHDWQKSLIVGAVEPAKDGEKALSRFKSLTQQTVATEQLADVAADTATEKHAD